MAGIMQRVGAFLGFGREEKAIGEVLALLPEFMRGQEAKSGARVTWQSALEVTTVFDCCRVIAEGISQVPFRVYQRTATGSQIVEDHPVDKLFQRKPNPIQTHFEFRETIAFHAALSGDAFVFINRVGRARRVKELLPIPPHRVEIQRNGWDVQYKVTADDGSFEIFPADAIWHIRGPSWDAVQGLAPVRLAREAMGLALATEGSHARFHKNAAQPSGVYSVDGNLSAEKMSALAKWIEAHVSGPAAHRPLILDSGAKWTSLQMSGVDAQHLETRKFQIEEICRAFRVMPIMVGFSDKTATYASAEQMFLAHLQHTLMPWYERIEASANVNLLSEEELDSGLYLDFDEEDLLRGTVKDRFEAYQIALGNLNQPGWVTPNEIRAWSDLNPLPGGDELMRPAQAADAAQTPGTQPGNA